MSRYQSKARILTSYVPQEDLENMLFTNVVRDLLVRGAPAWLRS